jgi:hypothetical protein
MLNDLWNCLNGALDGVTSDFPKCPLMCLEGNAPHYWFVHTHMEAPLGEGDTCDCISRRKVDEGCRAGGV